MPHGPSTCLFVCSNGNQVHIFQPLAEKLGHGGTRSVYLGLDQFYRQGCRQAVERIGGEYIEVPTSFELREWWSYSEEELSPFLHEAETTIDDIVSRLQPEVVVLGNDYGSLEQLCVRTAERHRAVTIRIQDGVQSPTVAPLAPFTPASLGDGGCDLQLTWGEGLAKRLRHRGASAPVIATGNPAHDAVVVNKRPAPKPPYHILLATQNFAGYRLLSEDEEIALYRELCQLLLSRDDVSLLLKPHPASQLHERYAALGKELGPRVEVGDVLPTLELFQRCEIDAVVVITSTVSIEAALHGIPVIALPKFASRKAAEKQQMRELLLTYLQNPQFPEGSHLSHQDYLAKHSVPIDGKAAERAAESIVSLYKQRLDPTVASEVVVLSTADSDDPSSQLWCLERGSLIRSFPVHLSDHTSAALRVELSKLQNSDAEFLVYVPGKYRLMADAIEHLLATLRGRPDAVAAFGGCGITKL